MVRISAGFGVMGGGGSNHMSGCTVMRDNVTVMAQY